MKSFHVAFIHHHLNRGGVSQVIFNQWMALKESPLQGHFKGLPIKAAVVHSGREPIDPNLQQLLDALDLESIVIPMLEYDSRRSDFENDRGLASELSQALAQHSYEPTKTILHFHNHSLGKNRALIPAIKQLANSGHRIFLQIHDMAEDFRPQNYSRLAQELPSLGSSLADVLPVANQIEFGVINQRDRNILEETGIAPDSIHYLPNSVSNTVSLPNIASAKAAFAKRNSVDPDTPLLLYPVRGIRRKNIGEAFLLTLISKTPVNVGLTLPPNNPKERIHYDRWKTFCQDLKLPVLFELGDQPGVSFHDNVAAADGLLTTSIVEGFGLVFLESFAFGKPLLGRDIPAITEDFKQSGIKFDRLYGEIRIPLDLIHWHDFTTELHVTLTETYRDFNRSVSADEYQSYLDSIQHQGWIDFARLTVCQQRVVLATVARDPRARTALQTANASLADWIPAIKEADQTTLIQHNQTIIESQYSATRTAESLTKIYGKLLDAPIAPVEANPNPRSVLKHFLNVGNFHPIRFGDRAQQDLVDYSFIIRESLQKISPIPTSVSPKLKSLPDIQAVVFDIYGTLLVSSSGDVGTDPAFADQSQRRDPRLDELLNQCGTDLDTAMERVKLQIKREHQQLRSVGIPFPEIDICTIWQSVLNDPQQDFGRKDREPPLERVKEIALRAELQTNPVWKMPGFESCLREIRNRQIPLGIISNAQFYTPPILESLAESSLETLGFERQLSHYSFRIGRAKPDQFLYKLAASSLQQFHTLPEQTLYIGNDVTKDMIPAHAIGFRTGLFAGDQRSLRCGDHGDPHLHPSIDLIFTDLEQISTVFG